MNTVGKILVILNFLFAVVVGAFLVVDFATRTVWKDQYDKLKREVEVINADRNTIYKEMEQLVNKGKEQELAVEKLISEKADMATEANAREQNLNAKVIDAQAKATEAGLSLQQALIDVKRLAVTEKDLKNTVQVREKSILELQDDVKKYRTEALASEQLAKSLADRNQELLVQVQALAQELERLRSGAGGPGPGPGGGAPLSITTGPNPPSTLVKGKVELVDTKDPTLIQISLGTDHGVNKNNTLEVFRFQPEPKYIGMVRIVDANVNKSVGRLIVPPGSTVRPQMRPGDLVWSYLAK